MGSPPQPPEQGASPLTPSNPPFGRIIAGWLTSPVLLARVVFVVSVTFLAYQLRPEANKALFISDPNKVFVFSAFVSAALLVLFEYSTNIISSKNILLAACGLASGLATAALFQPILNVVLPVGEDEVSGRMADAARAACAATFGYFGIILAIKHAERFQWSNLKFMLSNPKGPTYLLDTSAIIDGRISDLLKLRFFRGSVIVPEFVLLELQNIADSADAQRRLRGKRGLDTLEKIRKASPDMHVWSHDYPDIQEVDQKLVAMAKETQSILITNDYNLEKVATLQQINVSNINELANALRPPVFIGQTFMMDLTREGKEAHQAVGYLDDGTMVVVDEGRPMVGQAVSIVVTSILQTTAGRMVFARPERSGSANVVRMP